MANKQIKDYAANTTPKKDDMILIQTVAGSITKRSDFDSIHKLKHGYFNYNDLATATIPITHNGSEGFKALTNDIAGSITVVDAGPTNMTRVWDEAADQLDFTELAANDFIDLRVDIDVTTVSNNQAVTVKVEFAIGAFNFALEVDRSVFKTAGTYNMTSYTGFFLRDANIIDNPAEIQFDTDGVATVKVNGWLAKVTRA